MQALKEEMSSAVSEERAHRVRGEERLRQESSTTLARHADAHRAELAERESTFLNERERLQQELVAAQEEAASNARRQADAIRRLQDESLQLKRSIAEANDATARLESNLANVRDEAASKLRDSDGQRRSLAEEVERLKAALSLSKAETKKAKKVARDMLNQQKAQVTQLLEEHSSSIFGRMKSVLSAENSDDEEA